MNFVGCIPRFLKAHGGWILTALGIAGFGGTVILTAKEAPKVSEAIDLEINNRVNEVWERDMPEDGIMTDEWFNEHIDEVTPTFWDKVKIAVPYYWPAILTGTCTVGCMVGAQIFNMKQQAMLIGAYATLASQFDQYRGAIRGEYGDNVDKRAYEFSKKKIKDLEEEVQRLKEANGPYLYGIATLPGVIFEAKPLEIQDAIMHFNRNLILGGEMTLSTLYSYFGIPESVYDLALADSFGYNQYRNEVDFDCSYADFNISGVFSKSGRMVNIIEPVIAPYRIDCCDTDCAIKLDTGEYEFEEYPDFADVVQRSKHLAESYLEHSQLTPKEEVTFWTSNLFSLNGVSQQKHSF